MRTSKRDASASEPGANRAKAAAPPPLAGLAARQLAVSLVEGVLRKRQSLDDVLTAEETAGRSTALATRDRAFARLIAATVLRRHASLEAVLSRFIERPLPEDAARARTILALGAAQILLLQTPAHAAINLAVEQCRRDRTAHRFAKLTNAVLRRVAADGAAILASLDWPIVDIPPWIFARWATAYGNDHARRIAAASLVEAPLDLSLKEPHLAADWAARLGGAALATGSVRLREHARVEELPGYTEGAWWVQDAAAALPHRLLGDVQTKSVADLCAAPGGKTAALAAAGAHVTAVDASSKRLARLTTNMQRLGLAGSVETVSADLLTWSPPSHFDAVLLDAPCTATGTIRRHPDILHLKRPEDITRLAALQAALLAKAAGLVKSGGLLVFCTCSLEPEEGPAVIEQFLIRHPEFQRRPIGAGDSSLSAFATPDGDLRTFPSQHPADDPELGGMDGFYAARLQRRPA